MPQWRRPNGLEWSSFPIAQAGLFKQSAEFETVHPVERLV
jgi:hypothetical protein